MTESTDNHRLAKLLITVFIVFTVLISGAYLFGGADKSPPPPSPMGSGPAIEEQPGAVAELEFGPLDRPDGTAPADFRRPATSPEVMMNRTRAEGTEASRQKANDTDDADPEASTIVTPPASPQSYTTPPPRWSPDTDRNDAPDTAPTPDQEELANEIWEDRLRDTDNTDDTATDTDDTATDTDDPTQQAELEDEEALYDDDWPDDADPDADPDASLKEWQNVDNPTKWEAEAALRARDSLDRYQTELDRFADSVTTADDSLDANSLDTNSLDAGSADSPGTPGPEAPPMLAAMASRDALDVLYWLSTELGVARASAGTRRTVIERKVDSTVAGEPADSPPQPDATSPWIEIADWLWELQQSRFPDLEPQVQAVDNAAQTLEDLERDDPSNDDAHSEALLEFFEALETALDLMVDVGWDDVPALPPES